jgi:pimeloyl-[acyl-carrier protein] methyl ester esterase
MRERLHVEAVGAGPPLVLLHGFAMHSGVWDPLVTSLARRFRAHAVDLPGHGHSAPVAPYTVETLTSAVARHFATEGAPLTVIGWSLGATVALAWARAEPARIARLVLVSATPCFVSRPDWPHAIAADTLAKFGDELAVSYRLTLQRFLSLQLRGTDAGRATLAQLRRTLFERGEPDPGALSGALALLREADLRAQVRTIATPSLVVAGDRDTLTPRAAAAWLAETLPRARLATIAGAAHVPFLSHPDPFDRALAEFLDGR